MLPFTWLTGFGCRYIPTHATKALMRRRRRRPKPPV
jgi:hypothetical protein